jgi:hypothetical protein
MTTKPSRNDLPAEDIDLLILLERMFLYFRKYKWIYLLSILICTGLALATWSRLPKVYKSRLIVQSSTLSNLNFLQVVSNWNRLLNGGGHSSLADLFEIQPTTLGKVKSIKGSEVQRVFTPNNPHGFYIDVYVTDNAVLDELQQGILNGFENIDFVKRQLTIKKENLELLITEVKEEIEKLDSTKSMISSMMTNRNGQPSSMIVDISNLNRQRIDLNEKLLGFQQDLRFATAVQLLQGFSKFKNPAGPRMIVWLGLGIVGGFAIAFAVTLFRSTWKKVRLRLKEQSSTP